MLAGYFQQDSEASEANSIIMIVSLPCLDGPVAAGLGHGCGGHHSDRQLHDS